MGQSDEFCVKLVAPLQHNQISKDRIQRGHMALATAVAGIKAEERIKNTIFYREAGERKLLLNRKPANEDLHIIRYMD